jgi:glycosyltransferase involved in cell wall biosynthesis
MKILMIPRSHKYTRELKRYLQQAEVAVVSLQPFHYATPINIIKLLLCRIRGYNIIHVHWLYSFPFGFIMKAFCRFCHFLDIKIVWEMHNIVPHDGQESERVLSRWFYDKVDAVIFHSQDDIVRSKKLLHSAVEKKHIVIPHGNFHEAYQNTLSKKEAREILNIPMTRRVILCFGILRNYRGYEYLIEATREMAGTDILVVGQEHDKEVYADLLNHQKQMPHLRLISGWIPDNEVQIYFNASDIVVLPYTEITTSGVTLLAYTFSRPVISTDVGGMKEVVNEKIGMLVPPRNGRALKEAIDKMFAMDYEAMGKNAHEYAEKECSWEANAQKIKTLYESLVSPP